MTGTVLELDDIIEPDYKATQITDKWLEWDGMRREWKDLKEEIRRYVYATDTTSTTNSTLPWKNKTTIPKLCQIRRNLYANYTATMFPNRKSLVWEPGDMNSLDKAEAITNYMSWVHSQPQFKHEVDKIILDYIDYGNCFATVKWVDERSEQDDKTQMGYVGPMIQRISPMDIVFNPTAETFEYSPKIVRSIISLGELKEMLQRVSNDENRDTYEALWNYLKDLRGKASYFDGDLVERDNRYRIEGFASFRDYLKDDYVELLTFYGDLYDYENDTFLKNHVITVVDRHKLINEKPNPSFFGYPPIFHVAWDKRQDNLWGMGPLDNLVGMQYRMDHVENMKADIFDLITYPVQKVKGFVEDYNWEPGAKIFIGGPEEGDVELVSPDVNALQANFEIQNLERLMEEMAGAPREALGFRTPGEKTKYEVQRLENAASRLFQNKIKQFEELGVERWDNAMLELARRNMTGVNTIKVFDDEFKMATFQSLSVQDITGIGRLKPVASRHFAEQAELIQNLTNLTMSNLWPVVQPHFSSTRLADIIERALNLEDFELVTHWVALAEQAEAQRQLQVLQEQVMMESGTATGIGEDFDIPPGMGMEPNPGDIPFQGIQ